MRMSASKTEQHKQNNTLRSDESCCKQTDGNSASQSTALTPVQDLTGDATHANTSSII